MTTFVSILDILGVIVFAASGALVASRKGMDLVGFALLASITGVGGGTLRDVLLGRPAFWIGDPLAVWICLGVAVLGFFTAHLIARRYKPLLWADAIGISLYGVMGAELALRAGAGPLVATVMGMMTATFGGLIRDVICGETPLILRKEVYATAAAVAAATHVGLSAAGVRLEVAGVVGLVAGFAVRAAGIARGLSLPTYRRPAGAADQEADVS